ncbi:unnamed protein product [Meloidogyne enterolobii]|uniref:Uncharacterized protein n=1 Tax=Meloidogyne enterolobii TaxID=390850 RepID=A0ACB0Z217_MELEN
MYNLKLIFCIFLFFLIFVNFSIEKKCKCLLKQTKNPLFHRRFKRGGKCSCFGGEGATDDDYEGYTRRPGKEPMREEIEVEEIQRKSKNGSKSVLYICDNFFFSHVQFNVNFLSLN